LTTTRGSTTPTLRTAGGTAQTLATVFDVVVGVVVVDVVVVVEVVPFPGLLKGKK
jgi:hypothetical protein